MILPRLSFMLLFYMTACVCSHMRVHMFLDNTENGVVPDEPTYRLLLVQDDHIVELDSLRGVPVHHWHLSDLAVRGCLSNMEKWHGINLAIFLACHRNAPFRYSTSIPPAAW
jgi:hypothetical protein